MPVSKPKVSIQEIGPKRAQELLDANTHNRTVRQGLVDEYARDMVNGRWDMNGAPIRISDTNVLLDGQHRLLAVIQANLRVTFVIVEGLSEESQETMDTGAKRTAGDVLGLRGEANANVLASIARRAVIYQRNQWQEVSAHSNHPTILEIADLVDKDPRLTAAAHFAASHRRRWFSASLMGFAYWACSWKSHAAAEEFFNDVVTGAHLSERDPALLLRNRLIEVRDKGRGQSDDRQILGLTFRAWNMYRRGKKASRLIFGKGDDFPILI